MEQLRDALCTCNLAEANCPSGVGTYVYIYIHVRRSNQVDNEPITLYYVIQATSPNFPLFPGRAAFSSSFHMFFFYSVGVFFFAIFSFALAVSRQSIA